MRLVAFDVRRVRGVTRARYELGGPDAPNWIVLAGRNGSGKTAILQAIAMTLAGSRVIVQLAPRPDAFISYGKQEARADVWLEADADDWNAAELDGKTLQIGATWSRQSGAAERTTQGKRGFVDAVLWNRPAQGHVGWFFAAYGTSRFADMDLGNPPSLPGRGAAFASIFRRDVNLRATDRWVGQAVSAPPPLFGTPTNHRVALNVVRELLADGLFGVSFGRPELRRDGIWLARPEGMTHVSQVGQGLEALALLVTDIVRQMASAFGARFMEGFELEPGRPVEVPHSGLVLIDEIENHLHPQLQQHLGFWLKCHFPHVQFIVSTHSPFICQAAEEGGLLSVQESGDIEVVVGEPFRRIVNGTLDNAVLSDLFGLLHSYSEESLKLRKKLAKIEFKILDGEVLDDMDEAERASILLSLPGDPRTELERLDAALEVEE